MPSMLSAHRIAEWAAPRVLPREQDERLSRLVYHDAGHGYDLFGMHPTAVKVGLGLCRFAHDHYFRVQSHGIAHLPRSGPAILAANHSGMLPIDAAMIIANVAFNTDPPRIPRAVGDVFIPLLPIVGTGFARIGMVSGSRANVRHLLDSGELSLVFPEGAPGISKGWLNRYQLQPWRVGHAELAIRHRVPVVPIAVIGAEEAWPQLAKLEGFHWFGAPFLPIPATPLPLPARLHIHYGAPLALHETWEPDQADDPEVVDRAAELVRSEVASLIVRGRALRKGVFR
jgi:1-acyl-sn-glycerol-3-phosphate acyltransferase